MPSEGLGPGPGALDLDGLLLGTLKPKGLKTSLCPAWPEQQVCEQLLSSGHKDWGTDGPTPFLRFWGRGLA